MLMDEKVGTSSFSTEITFRLPDAAGGEGSSWRGGREGGSSSGALVAASARAAWCAAARWLRRALARGPRRRWRRPVGEDVEDDSVGGTGVVAISSFILVLPPTVVTDKEACPPAFSILWKTSNKRVNSSPIFASESEVEKKVHWSTETKGTYQKRFSGIRPLRGGGYPPFSLRKKTFFFSH